MNLIASFVVFGSKSRIVFMLDGYLDGYFLVYLIICIAKDGKTREKYIYGMYLLTVRISRPQPMKKEQIL